MDRDLAHGFRVGNRRWKHLSPIPREESYVWLAFLVIVVMLIAASVMAGPHEVPVRALSVSSTVTGLARRPLAPDAAKCTAPIPGPRSSE